MRPFPDDPQWLQLARKLPPDRVVLCLLKVGFRTIDIAERFGCTPKAVTRVARSHGLPPIPNGSTCLRMNGAPVSRWERLRAA